MTTATDYTAILYAADGEPNLVWNGPSGQGTPVIVTYSFVETADIAPWQAASSYTSNGYTSLTVAQRANFRDALALYAAAAGIVFVEAESGKAMINAMNTSGSGWGGWAATALSGNSYTGHGELVIDNRGNYDEGSYGFQTILHELGHAMGLEHPWEGNITLDPSIDNQAHTVMTYHNSSPSADHLGTLDVQAMRVQYGAAGAVAGWAVSLTKGVLSVTGSGRGDSILGVAGRNRIDGAGGDDSLYGRQDADTVHGGTGNDQLSGSSGGDRLYGDAGNDTIYGYAVANDWVDGDDSLYGGTGNDGLTGSNRADAMFGGSGRDVMDGRAGDDVLHGGGGADRMYGGVASGSWGNQTFYGDAGADLISGGAGNDTVYGGGDDDRLDGGAGWDVLVGGDGDDVFLAGSTEGSLEHFRGGAGADVFVIKAADTGSQIFLDDFTRGADKIDTTDLHLTFADHTGWGNWFVIGNIWINTALAGQLTAADFLM